MPAKSMNQIGEATIAVNVVGASEAKKDLDDVAGGLGKVKESADDAGDTMDRLASMAKQFVGAFTLATIVREMTNLTEEAKKLNIELAEQFERLEKLKRSAKSDIGQASYDTQVGIAQLYGLPEVMVTGQGPRERALGQAGQSQIAELQAEADKARIARQTSTWAAARESVGTGSGLGLLLPEFFFAERMKMEQSQAALISGTAEIQRVRNSAIDKARELDNQEAMLQMKRSDLGNSR